MNECHYWWHQIAKNYHEPDHLRYSLGAFIQAARNVTFMLQSEKAAFKGFDWYEIEWREHAKQVDVLKWIHERRTDVVHRSALVPGSWMDFRCIRDPEDPAYDEERDHEAYRLSSFECTHQLFDAASPFVLAHGDEDHGHELERHWEVEDFPDMEVLELTARVFEEMNALNKLAHENADATIRGNYEGDRPPCMTDTREHRIARFEARTQDWVNEPPGLHDD